MTDRRYGISTHLFHSHRLTREHLVHVAAHGFDAIELFATKSHFDYRHPEAAQHLAGWLSDTRLELHSVHAPIFEAMQAGQWVGPYSNAAVDEARRKAAIGETEAALALARVVPFQYLVLHLGTPSGGQGSEADNHAGAARRSVEEIAAMAAAMNVKLAIEVIPNPLSSAAALVRLLEEQLEGIDVGVCLDYGHAHLMGDLAEAIELLSGHLWTTHVHDNRGKTDDHLVPYAGGIDWDSAMMVTQKIGYEGVLMLEVTDTGDPLDVLRRSVQARERLDKAFVVF